MTTKIKDLELKTSKRTITKEITEVTFDGITTEIEEIDEIMDELEETDGWFTFVTINDDKLRKKLEELKVIGISRGSDSYRGRSYNTFRKVFSKVYDKYLDDCEEQEKQSKVKQ